MLRNLQIAICASVLLVLGCGGAGDTTAPPVTTTDDLIVSDAHAIRDALETFATTTGHFPTDAEVDPFVATVLRANRYTGLPTVPALGEAHWPGEIGLVLYYEFKPTPTVRGYKVEARGKNGVLITLKNTSAVSPGALGFQIDMENQADIVEAALAAFKAEAGYYPTTPSTDQTPQGNTLIDFLPGGVRLINPYTGTRTNPVDNAAGGLGDVGYTPVPESCGAGLVFAYVVDGDGPPDGRSILSRTSASPEEYETTVCVHRVRCAVELFMSQTGRYPDDVDTDTTPSNQTVLDLLSQTYHNAYTGAVIPRNGLAGARGDVGYSPTMSGGNVVGCVINGRGLSREIARLQLP